MKKLLLIVFSSFFIISVASAAVDFGATAPAQQTFHEADPTQPQQTPTAAQKALVKTQQQVAEPAHTAVAKASQSTAQAATDDNTANVSQTMQSQQTQQLQQQLARFVQTQLQFQQATNQKVAVLSNQIEKLQLKQSQLLQLMSMFNQQLATDGKHATAQPINLQALKAPVQQTAAERFENQYSMYIIIALLALILLMVIFKRRPAQALNATPERLASDETDTKDEYDFMNSSEAIPAKLDLAHAYIAMEDFTAARKVLQQVLSAGDKQQQQQAKDMLGKINKK